MNKEIRPPACPICHADLDTFEFLKLAASVFSAVGTREKCPRCHTVFYLESEEAGGLPVFTGVRRQLVTKVCACGCGWEFTTTHPDKVYFDNRHRQHAYDKKKILRHVP
jgi:hypothetical protein